MHDWLIRLKREIRDLKTTHGKKSLMKAYYASFSASLPDPYTPTAVRVTYASGDQPIITTMVGYLAENQIIPFAVNGNTQDFYVAKSDYVSGGGGGTIYFLSTRPITNIQLVSV